jgi:curved DNA-binding protein CbpA
MFKVLDSAVPIACWSCSVGHTESTLFCPYCSKIQPPPGGDYFSVFGLKPKLNLDLQALETEFHRLSRRLHPDRFARAEENEKQWSLADTALLNDAYRTLKDPLRRTEYLLKLLGAKTEAETKQAASPQSAGQRRGKRARSIRRSKLAWPRTKRNLMAYWRRLTRICATSGRRGMRAPQPCATQRRRKCRRCLTGGATSAIWSAT